MSTFDLFPARAPLVNGDGTLTQQGMLWMRRIYERVGGANGLSTVDVDAGSYAAMQPQSYDQQFSDVVQYSACATIVSSDVFQAGAQIEQSIDVFQADIAQCAAEMTFQG